MTKGLEDDIRRFAASMDAQQTSQQKAIPEITERDTQPEETIHIHYFPDAIVILKEEDQTQVIESTPVLPQKTSMMPAYAFCCFSILLIVSMLAFQLYCIVNPPAATITILPKSQTVLMKDTLQLGRVLSPLTISQSQNTATTGKGHQSAKAATGTVTFYNGQFQGIFLAAGTILTGASGVQILTDQDVTIPAGNPPSYGQVSVLAHAISPGLGGNIPAFDINQVCCATSVLAKNTQPFSGGQNERDFSTVSQQDIHKISTPLKATVIQSMQGALQGQLKPGEQLQLLACTSTVSSDHQIGAEAIRVKVTLSQTCSAIAYSSQELATKATAILSTQALQKTGAGYTLFGTVHVSVKQASVSHTTTPLVFLSFSASGTWMYGLSHIAQQQIKHLLAGKTTQQALQMLRTLPGIGQASIRFTGFADTTRLPKSVGFIHIMLLVM